MAWGGTPHLEDLGSAHEKYKDRLRRWSVAPAFPDWQPGDLEKALAAADAWYPDVWGKPYGAGYAAVTAVEYWQYAAEWWASAAPLALTISDAQRAKIMASVNQSAGTALNYQEQRDPKTHLPEIPAWSAVDLKVPWWAWGAGALLVWHTIRK